MGLLPRGSVARRIDREMFVLLGGPAALLMQVAHPLVAAGVDQHSDFRSDPVGRLVRTLNTTLAVVFGGDRDARAAIRRMDRVHARVRGVSVAGDPYSARDPALMLWVQTTLVMTSLRLYEAVGGPLEPAEREAYWSETKEIARLLGLTDEHLPASVADLERYERGMVERGLTADETVRSVGRSVLRPLAWLPEPLYWPSDALASALLPPELRRTFGLRYGTAERLFFEAVVVAVRGLRRVLPEALTVVPHARRRERASRSQ